MEFIPSMKLDRRSVGVGESDRAADAQSRAADCVELVDDDSGNDPCHLHLRRPGECFSQRGSSRLGLMADVEQDSLRKTNRSSRSASHGRCSWESSCAGRDGRSCCPPPVSRF